MKVAVLFGGRSTEHDVSCVSAASVLRNMDQKHTVLKIGITAEGAWYKTDASVDDIESGAWEKGAKTPVEVVLNEHAFRCGDTLFAPDVIFPVLHGKNGEDGTVQGLFELMRVPYVGCKVLASSVCMDKAYMKQVFAEAGLRQVDFVTVEKADWNADKNAVLVKICEKLRFPVFIKPSNAGSSVGITRCKTKEEVPEAMALAFSVDRRVVAETGVEDPQEIEVAVLGNDEPTASVTGRILPANEFYDYEAKYSSPDSSCRIPSGSPYEAEIRDLAVRAYRACDCKGLSRVDFLVAKDGTVYINEINTMPGFTSISMYPKLSEASGIPYATLIERLMQLALEYFEA